MKYLVFTVFSRLDGSSDQLILAPTVERMKHDFSNNLYHQNLGLSSKKMPLISNDDYEIRLLGSYDSVSCTFDLLDKFEVVPYIIPVVQA